MSDVLAMEIKLAELELKKVYEKRGLKQKKLLKCHNSMKNYQQQKKRVTNIYGGVEGKNQSRLHNEHQHTNNFNKKVFNRLRYLK